MYALAVSPTFTGIGGDLCDRVVDNYQIKHHTCVLMCVYILGDVITATQLFVPFSRHDTKELQSIAFDVAMCENCGPGCSRACVSADR